jgi:hypothetical protein
MNLTSLTARAMELAIVHSLARASSSRADKTGAFLYELHSRGFAVVPVIDAEFEEASPKREPRT